MTSRLTSSNWAKSTRISIVMLSWQRPENVYRIAQQQCEYAIVDELIVFNNNKDVRLKSCHPKMHVLNSTYDLKLRARWCASTFARNNAISLQDDDLIVSEDGYERLVGLLAAEPERMYGIEGRSPDASNRYSVKSVRGEVPILLTQCVVFHWELIVHVLQCEMSFYDTYGWIPRLNGEDIFLSYCAMDLFGRRNLAVKTPVERLPAPHAVSHQPNHQAVRTKVMRCCQQFFGL